MDQRELRLNQTIGMVVGIVGALMTANFWPSVRAFVGGWAGTMMWGMALGGFFGSFAKLSVVGKLITRREHMALNFTIGLLLPFMFIGLLLLALNISG